jgi:histidyl-tRNA synthetase
VKQTLDGIGVSYVVNEQVVRGLDYYMRTAFEFTTTKLGAQNAVLAGGRYDGLVRGLGGPDVAGIGFAMGMERLVLLLQDSTKKDPVDDVVYFAVIGELAGRKALPVINLLRRDGIRVEWDYAAKSLKSQMRKAGKIEAGSVVIMGDDEITRGEVIVKNMKTGEQQNVRIKDLPFHFINIGG